ncbi:MAG TPA: hypothetical protein VFF17_01580 [Thermoanaerobaculia bacterium]|nr:hypothetical protein [Thermoanaerobaculia bacterium]
MDANTKQPRRTGWVILVLMAATNFLPWMEPLIRETLSAELVGAPRLRLSMGACLLGGALVAMCWLAGRHSSSPLPRALSRPRLIGFRIALGCAAMNIFCGAIVARYAASMPPGRWSLDVIIAVVWFVAVLPGEVLSSYLTGRGTVRRPAPEPALPAETATREMPIEA